MNKETPEEKSAVSIIRNRRSDAMFAAAYLAVTGLVYVVIFEKGISEYGQGVITLTLGAFLGYLTAMYGFETGTTRSGQAKDEMIKNMAENTINATEKRQIISEEVVQGIAKSAPIVAAAAVAAATATNGSAASTGTLKTGDVQIDAAGADIVLKDGNLSVERADTKDAPK